MICLTLSPCAGCASSSRISKAGVSDITLVMNSGGGHAEPTPITYSFLRPLPAKIKTHAQGIVASAATLLFLAGQ